MGKHLKQDPQTKLVEGLDELETWVKKMTEWGRKVRIDIIRLETAAGLAKGDPDDPPPWPPE